MRCPGNNLCNHEQKTRHCPSCIRSVCMCMCRWTLIHQPVFLRPHFLSLPLPSCCPFLCPFIPVSEQFPAFGSFQRAQDREKTCPVVASSVCRHTQSSFPFSRCKRREISSVLSEKKERKRRQGRKRGKELGKMDRVEREMAERESCLIVVVGRLQEREGRAAGERAKSSLASATVVLFPY